MSAAPPRPRRLVILGRPVHKSLSPRFQNAALAAAGLDVRYEALDVAPDALGAVLAELHSQDAGGNVTMPHKEAVRRACVRVTPLADRVGAVNTFWSEAEGLVGDNTDVGGFLAAAERLLDAVPREGTVALLGAGGAARAVLAGIEARWGRGVRVAMHNRTLGRAESLAARFAVAAEQCASAEEAARRATILVVNATAAGFHDDSFPVSLDEVSPGVAVLDLVYRAGETAWVRAARSRGLRAADGIEMLLEQGALAFERWFGLAPDRDAMRRAIA
jgi:shikimate dehydrogenase